jgi:nitrate reductase assembly molybdenum cofactor insertion protein NarJ
MTCMSAHPKDRETQHFKLFSLIFSYPSEEVLEEIKSMVENLPEFKVLLEQFFKVDLETLQTEYTRLFISTFPTLVCPPYESYYREGLVYGDTSVEVREIYERHGLKYTYESEPPDHISVELEFLSITNSREFLRRLKEWVFDFTERVKKNSTVYGVFAEELEKFLERLKV